MGRTYSRQKNEKKWGPIYFPWIDQIMYRLCRLSINQTLLPSGRFPNRLMAMLILALSLTACSKQEAKRAIAATPTPHQEPACLISASGIGPLKLGMTLLQAKQAMPAARFARSTDAEGLAWIEVTLGKHAWMELYADENDADKPIDWTKTISLIETRHPGCRTNTGTHPGSSVTGAERAYGKIRRIVQSEIEAREFAEFARQPAFMQIRLDYCARFPDGKNETLAFNPGCKILSFAVSTDHQAPNDLSR